MRRLVRASQAGCCCSFSRLFCVKGINFRAFPPLSSRRRPQAASKRLTRDDALPEPHNFHLFRFTLPAGATVSSPTVFMRLSLTAFYGESA